MIRQGSEVSWKWGSGMARGKVIETYTTDITMTIKDAEITRKGEPGNKALLIEQQDGDRALKLESEVEKV